MENRESEYGRSRQDWAVIKGGMWQTSHPSVTQTRKMKRTLASLIRQPYFFLTYRYPLVATFHMYFCFVTRISIKGFPPFLPIPNTWLNIERNYIIYLDIIRKAILSWSWRACRKIVSTALPCSIFHNQTSYCLSLQVRSKHHASNKISLIVTYSYIKNYSMSISEQLPFFFVSLPSFPAARWPMHFWRTRRKGNSEAASVKATQRSLPLRSPSTHPCKTIFPLLTFLMSFENALCRDLHFPYVLKKLPIYYLLNGFPILSL